MHLHFFLPGSATARIGAAIVCSSSLLFAAALKTNKQEFVKGATLVGGANGMYFDADNNLWVAQVIGQTISKLDPESGTILEQLGPAEKVFFPDDITVAPDGSLYWTDPMAGTVLKRSPIGNDVEFFYEFGTYRNANPVTLSDDGARLFFAQCFYEGPEGNGLYQLDLTTGLTTAILEGVPHCASNAMDYRNGALYTTRLFEGRIVRIDLQEDTEETAVNRTTLPMTPKDASSAISDVTTAVMAPSAAKFDSKGTLHVLDTSSGQVLKVDIENKDSSSNVEVLAQLPFIGLDNLAFDANDRLYVSSWSTGYVVEILSKDGFRTVSKGSFSSTSGLAILGDVLYASGPLELHGYDTDTAEEILRLEILLGMSELIFPSAIVSTKDDHLAVLSFFGNIMTMWDVKANKPLFYAEFSAPTDAHPFKDGMLVVEAANGDIVYASGPELADRSVMANLPGCFFLAGNDQDVFISCSEDGAILQLVANGATLDPPVQVSSGHNTPEGIELDGNDLLVVAVGDGTLERINLETGEVTSLADGLGFNPALPEIGLPFGLSNDVVVHDGFAYVNADGDNILYKISLTADDTSCGAEMNGGLIPLVAALVLVLAIA